MRRTILFLLAVLLGACTLHDPDKYTIGPDNIDSILALTASTLSVPADGVSTTVLTVQISPLATKRQIDFSTTDGTFTVGAQADAKKATVIADASGKAVTELRSSTTVGTVKVDAQIQVDTTQTIRRTLDLSFALPSADNVLTLTSSASTVPADGFSRVHITATLKLTAGTAAQRQIDLKSSEGLLYAAGKAADVHQVIAVSADGVADVDLESTKNIRSAQVTATFADVTRELVIDQTAIDPSTVITLTAESATAPADGQSLTRLTARIAAALPAGRRTVTFAVTPSSVTVTPSQTIADASNQVSVDLQSIKTTGPVRVTATVDGTSAQATVSLVPALPDRILLTTSKPAVTANATDSLIVTATLQRDIGTVTAGTNLTLIARDATGASVGTFAASTVSDANGSAQTTFFPGVGATVGPVTITATAGSAVGSVRITIAAP